MAKQDRGHRDPDGRRPGAHRDLLLPGLAGEAAVLYDRIRLGFLVFTLVWIGWIAQAQLSVVNVVTFFSALGQISAGTIS